MIATSAENIHYIGDNAIVYPPQPEAYSYFARMTTSPSAVFRDAVNKAMYDWKKQGSWPFVTHLWLLCADTEQAGLLNVVASTDTATKNGSPTFTALKGFSAFSATAYLSFGPSTVGLGAANQAHGIYAGQFSDGGGSGFYFSSAAGAVTGYPGIPGWSSSGVFQPGTTGNSGPRVSAATPVIAMGGASAPTFPGFSGLTTGSTAGNGSGYATNPVAPNPIDRLSVYGFQNGMSATQRRYFMATLSVLLTDIGALE
jgi:hypothetical protein